MRGQATSAARSKELHDVPCYAVACVMPNTQAGLLQCDEINGS